MSHTTRELVKYLDKQKKKSHKKPKFYEYYKDKKNKSKKKKKIIYNSYQMTSFKDEE